MSSTPEVSLRITAQDGASDVLRKIQAQLTSTGNSAGVFNQKVSSEGIAGLSKLNKGFEDLARTALGFGRAESQIATGIAESFGATVPVLLAVAAAVALGTEVWKHYEEPIKKSREETEKWIEAQEKAARVRFDPNGELRDNIDKYSRRLEEITTKIAELKANPTTESTESGDVITDTHASEIAQLTKEQTELTNGLTAAKGNLKAKGDELVLSLIMEGNAIQFGELVSKRMAIALNNDLTPAQKRSADAALLHNAQLVAQKKAAEDAAKAIANLLPFQSTGHNLGGQLDLTRNGATSQQQQASIDAANRGGGAITGTGAGTVGQINDVTEALKKASPWVQTVGDGLAGMFEGIGDGSESALKAVEKFIGGLLIADGKSHILKGVAKIAEGGWPPNPAAIASGLKQIAAGGAEVAFGAFLGSSGGGGGGGSTGGGGTTQPLSQTQAPLASQGTVTILTPPKKAWSSWQDPAFQEFIQKTVTAAQGRRLVFG